MEWLRAYLPDLVDRVKGLTPAAHTPRGRSRTACEVLATTNLRTGHEPPRRSPPTRAGCAGRQDAPARGPAMPGASHRPVRARGGVAADGPGAPTARTVRTVGPRVRREPGGPCSDVRRPDLCDRHHTRKWKLAPRRGVAAVRTDRSRTRPRHPTCGSSSPRTATPGATSASRGNSAAARSSARGSSRSCCCRCWSASSSSTATATSSSARRTTAPARIVTFLVLISLGWQFARDIGRALGPTLFRRMDPGTAGTVGFLLRLVTMPSRC